MRYRRGRIGNDERQPDGHSESEDPPTEVEGLSSIISDDDG